MEILLINPRIDLTLAYGKKFAKLGALLPPLGLCYLAGAVRKAGHKVAILDANLLGLSLDKIMEEIKRYAPKVVGLYATTLGINAAEIVAGGVKENFPQIKTIIGGPHISGYGQKALECQSFDYGIIGEGEKSFVDFVNAVENNSNSLGALNGLVWRDKGMVVKNGISAPIENLDALPFPARDLLPDIRQYHPKKMFYRKLPFVHIFTSRGCPFQCVFCQTPFGKKVRFHSAQYVADEITHLVKTIGVREVKINDDTFNLIEPRVLEIFDILAKRGISVAWSCNLRADTVKSKQFLKAIKERGCWMVGLGLESGNQKVLDELKKDITLAQSRQVCEWAREAGLRVQASFIIGNPTDTEQTILETIEYAKSLPIDYPSFAYMTPFPGTEIWQRASEYGTFSYEKFSDLRVSHSPRFIPYGLTEGRMKELYRKAYRDVYLNPRMVLRHASKVSSFSEASRLCSAAFTLLGFSNDERTK